MGDVVFNTPYDDVFRTMVIDCTSLIIPVINEFFGEHYTGDETIVTLQNEHFLNQQDANTKEIITDNCFSIGGNRGKKYHIECQSTPDNSMLIRMFEYDSQIALEGGELEGDLLTVTFPQAGVLFLRHTRNTPDTLTVRINTPDGSISYQVPVMKLQKYTIDEIFAKNLLFLIPFHIFCYEKEMKSYAKDAEWLQKLEHHYAGIRSRLEKLCMDGTISEYVKCTLIDMTRKVVTSLAAKYENVREGVNDVMGGKVLEYEAKTILRKGISQGRQEGLEAGRREGLETGRIEGLETGRREGLETGHREGRIESCIDMLRAGMIKISDAAKYLNMSEEELKTYL
jgi:hypothetical protein